MEKSEVRTSSAEVAGRLALVVVAAAVALLLTCRKWDNPLDPVGDHAPFVPEKPSPTDFGIARNSGLVLTWQSHDPDEGDTAYFDVYFDTATPPRLVRVGRTDMFFRPISVAGSTRYYWQVIAYDNHNDSSAGPIWQFTTVAAPAITAPDTGARLRVYSSDTIVWTGGAAAPRRASGGVQVSLEADRGRPASRRVRSAAIADVLDSTVVFHSTDDGASWIRLGRATTPGQFVWQVPEPATESARVMVRFHAAGDTMSGTSGRFVVVDTLPPSAIIVTSPDSTAVWAVGSVHDVTWSGGTKGVDSSLVYFSTDNGANWTRQGRAETPGVYKWTVPGPATSQAKVEVHAFNRSVMTAGRSGTFSVIDSL